MLAAVAAARLGQTGDAFHVPHLPWPSGAEDRRGPFAQAMPSRAMSAPRSHAAHRR